MTDDKRIGAACKVVGCKIKDLLKSRIDEDGGVVVLIVGPVGFKHIVPFADLAAPSPVTAKLEALMSPVTAEKVLPKRRRSGGKAAATAKKS